VPEDAHIYAYLEKKYVVNHDQAMMKEAVRTSETLVQFNVTTQRYITEDSKLLTRRRENLKSHKDNEPLFHKRR
jgi:hypothetical protein